MLTPIPSVACLQDASELAEMLSGMEIAPGAALRGVPAPQGLHIRFSDTGDAQASPSSRRLVLKGLPEASGSHIYFSED